MNIKLKEALICLLKEEDKVSSWGISNINIDESSINFNVDGFLYKGNICIKCYETCYEIHFEREKNIRCLNADELTDILDNSIEKSDNYLYDLEQWLSSFR